MTEPAPVAAPAGLVAVLAIRPLDDETDPAAWRQAARGIAVAHGGYEVRDDGTILLAFASEAEARAFHQDLPAAAGLCVGRPLRRTNAWTERIDYDGDEVVRALARSRRSSGALIDEGDEAPPQGDLRADASWGREPADVVGAVAAALGVPLVPGRRAEAGVALIARALAAEGDRVVLLAVPDPLRAAADALIERWGARFVFAPAPPIPEADPSWVEALHASGDVDALQRIRASTAGFVAMADRDPAAALAFRHLPALAPTVLDRLGDALQRCDDDVLRARLLLSRGALLRVAGRAHAADADLEQALSLAVLADEQTLAADALRERAMAHVVTGADAVKAGLEQAALVHRARGNAVREALCWSGLAVFFTARGDPEKAAECLQTARGLLDPTPDRVYRPGILALQAAMATEAGDVEGARALSVEAHDLYEALGERQAAGQCALHVSRMDALAGRIEESVARLAAARRALVGIADAGTLAALDVGERFVDLARVHRAIETGAFDVAARALEDLAPALEELRSRPDPDDEDAVPLVERSPVFRTALRQLESAWWNTPDVVVE